MFQPLGALHSPHALRLTLAARDRMLTDRDRFLGLGNNAWVFRLPTASGDYCSKNLWRSLDVECRSKAYGALPPVPRRLREIQDYFAAVREKQRAYLAKGLLPPVQNKPEVEAQYNNRARDLAAALGWPELVPRAEAVIPLERNLAGQTTNGDRFEGYEKVATIVFTRVAGPSIQDYILAHDQYPDLAGRIRLDVFAQRLTAALTALARDGWHHNDVSNRNLMIEAATGEPRLIDFGASSSFGGSLERDLGHLDDCLGWLRRALQDPETTRQELFTCLQA